MVLNLNYPMPDGEGLSLHLSIHPSLMLNAFCDVRGDLGEEPAGFHTLQYKRGSVIASTVKAVPEPSRGIIGAIFPPSARSWGRGGQAAVNNGIALPLPLLSEGSLCSARLGHVWVWAA